jgi:hypothetical protein
MKKSNLFCSGENIAEYDYPVLNERAVRASAGIMLLLASIASINGFILNKFIVIPYIVGFLLLNFLVGVFINPKFVPTYFVGKWIVSKQKPIYIGAIQKRFAWSLGVILSATIFILSLFLINDSSYFNIVCPLCLICIILMYFESVFGICIGCKLYFLAIKLKLIKKSKHNPKCMGDSCEINKKD